MMTRYLRLVAPAVLLIFLVVALYGWPSTLLPTSPSSASASSHLKHIGHPHAGYTEGASREIFSVSTSDRKYFKIDFSPRRGMNPNVIPHPTLENTWFIVAQLDDHAVEGTVWSAELVCTAGFTGGKLKCREAPLVLTIGKTPGAKCTGDIGYYNFGVGPHDARVFYGPSIPYVIFGSQSEYTCFGLWIQDFRVLTDWPFEFYDADLFRLSTEIQRPGKYGAVEKNYFIFWDKDENMYAHHDIFPKRVFAQLSKNGSVGPDLAPLAAANDEACMAKYMPTLPIDNEHVHQATNSLAITLCKRADPQCKPDNSNTFILTIFQVKKYYDSHCVYEPYLLLFQQHPPFAIYGISTKPFWISGRGKPGAWKMWGGDKTLDQTQMFYITSVSWKKGGLTYHGFIDDVLFVLFGIEDHEAGGIDVTAGDLLVDLGLCGYIRR